MNWTSSKFKAIALKNIKKMKRQATEWGNYLQFMCLAKELYPEYVRRQIIKKANPKDLDRHFQRRQTHGQQAHEKVLAVLSRR